MIRAFSGRAWQSDCLEGAENRIPPLTGVKDFSETCSKWVLDRIEFRNGGFQELNSRPPSPECLRVGLGTIRTVLTSWPAERVLLRRTCRRHESA